MVYAVHMSIHLDDRPHLEDGIVRRQEAQYADQLRLQTYTHHRGGAVIRVEVTVFRQDDDGAWSTPDGRRWSSIDTLVKVPVVGRVSV